MVSAIGSLNQYPVNKEVLEVARRLQSLGYSPSGNLVVDRQRLQAAELKKRQSTLASNSEVNLTKLEGTNGNFASALNNLEINNGIGIDKVNNDQEIGLIDSKRIGIGFNVFDKQNAQVRDDMSGAVQLAELNKLKLGLIA